MTTGPFGGLASLSRRYALCGRSAALAIIVACAPAGLSRERAKSQSAAYVTTAAYVAQFYPLWFTYYQYQVASHNRMVGPTKISPVYQIVVAINDDTLYASTFLNLTNQPIILTIPATTTNYSILTLDPYGTVFDVGLPAGAMRCSTDRRSPSSSSSATTSARRRITTRSRTSTALPSTARIRTAMS
jgi:Protein of unknown function (DUF1254)